MKSLRTIKNVIEKNRESLREKFKVKAIGVFGSYSRGAVRRGSDVDILVEFSETPDFFRFIKLEAALGKILGEKVDLVTRKALKPAIKRDVLKEIIFI